MMRTIGVVVLALVLNSCGEAIVVPHWVYEADFDTSKIKGAEKAMKEIAEKWDLRFHEENRESVKFLTQDKDAFLVAFLFKEDAVLIMTNVGVGETISMMVVDYGKMPVTDLERMTDEVIETLRCQLGIEFRKQESTLPIKRSGGGLPSIPETHSRLAASPSLVH